MDHRAKVLGIFISMNALIGLGAYTFIFVGGFKPRFVVPVTAIFAATNIWVFASQFSAAKKESSVSVRTEKSRETELSTQAPGIKFLRIVTIATMCIGALIIISFIVESRFGVLNPDDVHAFIPKAAFGGAMAVYILNKTKKRPLL